MMKGINMCSAGAGRSGLKSMRHGQRGVMTTFTGVLVLILLTIMTFFAVRVGVFEQRVSANDARQKLAFHAAESGVQHAKEWLLPNHVLIASYIEDHLPDGTDGWLSATAASASLRSRSDSSATCSS